MRLGIIGTGRIGSTLARILVAADHEVVLANSRGPRSIGPLLAELGPGAGGAPPPPTAPPRGRRGLMVARAPGPGRRPPPPPPPT
ncbi:NAD(P)-binding domain-containing protein, partial [Streptomyces goshikiensis]|uniref:NAD(P)-binding domain-containing protein n=1 Tax=Streptomyces goshikiensis TaxID=1942 RepID=UPI0036777FFF